MKKIITVVSPFQRNNWPGADAAEYDCKALLGEGISVEGRLTNEAPIKALLKLDPEIQEVIAIASRKTCEEPSRDVNGEEHESAYTYLQKAIQGEFSHVAFNTIECENEMEFGSELLPEVLQRVKPGDVIYLETTGGFRDTVSSLMQLAQVLTYQGTQVARAVYSNNHSKKMEDVTGTYRTYSLISGLNEFQNSGAVATLKAYFEPLEEQPREVQELVEAMEKTVQSISMCRLKDLSRNMKKFRESMENAEKAQTITPLLRQLLPIFEQKFPKLEDTYYQIEWCLNNNLIQQALTIVSDRIPNYIMEKRYLTVDRSNKEFLNWANEVAAKSCENRGPAMRAIDPTMYKKNPQHEQLVFMLHLSRRDGWDKKKDPMGATIDGLGKQLKDTPYKIHDKLDVNSLMPILQDFMYAQTMRNMVAHASSEPISESKKNYLQKHQYPTDFEDLDKVKDALELVLKHMKRLESKTKPET